MPLNLGPNVSHISANLSKPSVSEIAVSISKLAFFSNCLAILPRGTLAPSSLDDEQPKINMDNNNKVIFFT